MTPIVACALAAERTSGSAPIAAVLRRIGASSVLERILREQDVSTAEDVELLSAEDMTIFGLSTATRAHVLQCARSLESCSAVNYSSVKQDGSVADDGRRLSDPVDQHSDVKSSTTATDIRCIPRDRRKFGKCAAKKKAGECSSKLWGCDHTCGRCLPNGTLNLTLVRIEQQSKDSEDDDDDDGSIVPLMPSPKQARCRDLRRTDRCLMKKQDGQCNTWGCDATCGKCGALQVAMAAAELKMVGQRSRPSTWWVRYVRSQGSYSTAVVPTLCKRLDRLVMLVSKLSSMDCIGEVMVVSRSPCVEQVNQALATSAGLIARQARAGVRIQVVDMGGWDRIYGPAARFFAASRARESVLVHLDDDEIPCEKQVCRVALHALMEPIGLYGHHKRICTSGGYNPPGNPLNTNHWHVAPFNVLLTLFAATSRVVNDAFVRYFSTYAEPLASTRGNGEDIAYNHFLLRHFNKTPTYVRKAACEEVYLNGTDLYEGGFSKLNDEGGISSGRWHYRLRRRMCRHLWALPHWGATGRAGPIKYERLIPAQEDGGMDAGGVQSAV